MYYALLFLLYILERSHVSYKNGASERWAITQRCIVKLEQFAIWVSQCIIIADK